MKPTDTEKKLESLDAVNAEGQRIFDDPEGFVSDPDITLTGNAVSENRGDIDTSDASEPKKRRKLSSYHRSHHHHHSHSSSNEFGDTGEHRSSGSHESGSSHRSTSRHHHHRSHRHRTGSDKSYTGNDAYKGQVGLEIDSEEFEKFHAEHMEQFQKGDTGDDRPSVTPMQEDPVSYEEPLQCLPEGNSGMNATPLQEKTEDVLSAPRLAGTILAAREANPRETRKASSVKSLGSLKRKKKATISRIIMRVLIGIAAALALCVCVLFIMRAHGQASMTQNPDDLKIIMPKEETPDGVDKVEDDGKTVTYKGHKYRWNDKISTFLILGTDRTVEQQQSGMTTAGNNGQADAILLGVVDNKNKKISFININRDTFVPVAEYTADGTYVGDKKMQICLSYAYGKDDVTSCRYTAEAVSKYLYGMPVNFYTRISYDAVPVLNDSVGGVTVTISEDLTEADSAFTKGKTITLTGSQALKYVRWRNKKIISTNEERISHQKQYLNAFMKRTIEVTRSDLTLPLGLYVNAKPFMTSNVTLSQITYLTSKVLEYGIPEGSIRSISGKSVAGEGNHIEFYPDETALYEMMLDTFYNKVD